MTGICVFIERKEEERGHLEWNITGNFMRMGKNRPDTANTNFYTIYYDYDEMTHWKFLFRELLKK